MTKALGLIEVIGLVGAVEGADAALKAANVHLNGVEKVGSGIMTIQITGDVGAVTAAVDAGAEAAKRICTLRASHVIPRVDDALFEKILSIPPSEIEKGISKEIGEEKKKEPTNGMNESKPEESTKDMTGTKLEESTKDMTGTKLEESTKDMNEPQLEEPIMEDIQYIPKSDQSIREESGDSQRKYNWEELNRKSNSSLKDLIVTLGIEASKEELKTAKKQELIQLILRKYE